MPTISNSETVTIVNNRTEVVSVGIQGPSGPQGATGPQGPSGSEEEAMPTSPVRSHQTSSSLASGGSVNLDATAITNLKTGKVQQITLSSSAACKWVIKKSAGGSDTTLDIIFTGGVSSVNPSHEWEPPHKDYATQLGNGSTNFFRVTVTNLDANSPADVYATFFFDEVT